MNAGSRPPEGTATKQAATPTFKIERDPDSPQGRRIYLVRGVKRIPSRDETMSAFRRTLPAANRLAAEWIAKGRGPVTIHAAEVVSWEPVAFDPPDGWWVP